MTILTLAVLPVAASAWSVVGMPGRAAGVKVTVPSMAEVVVETWVARRFDGGQTWCAPQGGAHA